MELVYRTCLICGVKSHRLGSHVKHHGLTQKEYYDTYLRKPDDGMCLNCGEPTQFNRISRGYYMCCSRECHSQFHGRKPEEREARSTRMSRTMLIHNQDPEFRKANSDRVKKQMENPERRAVSSVTMSRTLRRLHSTDQDWQDARDSRFAKCRDKWNKKVSSDPVLSEERNARLCMNSKPNRLESRLLWLINEIVPGWFVYTGAGGVINIGGKWPDFVNAKYKLVIEAFGNYWHDPSEVCPRTEYFKRFGFETLVIWESDFYYDREGTQKKIREFLEPYMVMAESDLRKNELGELLEYRDSSSNHNVIREDERDGLKIGEHVTISSQASSREDEGSETRRSNLPQKEEETPTSAQLLDSQDDDIVRACAKVQEAMVNS